MQVSRPDPAPRRHRAGPAHSRLPAHLVQRVSEPDPPRRRPPYLPGHRGR